MLSGLSEVDIVRWRKRSLNVTQGRSERCALVLDVLCSKPQCLPPSQVLWAKTLWWCGGRARMWCQAYVCRLLRPGFRLETATESPLTGTDNQKQEPYKMPSERKWSGGSSICSGSNRSVYSRTERGSFCWGLRWCTSLPGMVNLSWNGTRCVQMKSLRLNVGARDIQMRLASRIDVPLSEESFALQE